MKLARLHSRPEVFLSVQGEGKSIGRPSVFVRLSTCNLYCTFCDTDYTWNWQGTAFRHRRDAEPGYRKFDPGRDLVELPPGAIAAEVARFDCRNVVLTGGEPLLQQGELAELLRSLRALDPEYRFEIETNGTVVPAADLDALVEQYNVSPKLENSGVQERHRVRSEALAFFARSPKATFKFVVMEARDVEEVADCVRLHSLPADRIWLMPEGSSSETIRGRQRWLADVCAARGFQLGDRLHIHLYGDERGK